MKPETIRDVCKAHLEVEQEYGIVIDEPTAREILSHCMRKLKCIGKGEEYLPLLYRCELPLQLAMKEINRLSEAIHKEKKGGEQYVHRMPYDTLSSPMPQRS